MHPDGSALAFFRLAKLDYLCKEKVVASPVMMDASRLESKTPAYCAVHLDVLFFPLDLIRLLWVV